MAEVKNVSVAITGAIPWKQNPIYPGITPISFAHHTELLEYIIKIQESLDVHKAYKSYVAHPAVNLEYPGFITPELIARINAIENRIAQLNKDALVRIPQGIIGMYDYSVKSLPSGWELSTQLNGKFVLCANTNYTYPIHEAVAQDASALTNLFTVNNMPSHTHDFNNAFFAEAKGCSAYQEMKFGKTLGSAGSDTDNSLMYIDDYTDYAGTDVSSTTFSTIEPKHIEIPFIMKSYDAVNVSITHPTSILVNGSTTLSSVRKGTVVTLTSTNATTIYANGYKRKVPCKYVVSGDTKLSLTAN